MALSEETKLASVEVLILVNAINIRLENNIYRDGELISSTNERKAYCKAQRTDFLSDFPDLTPYADLAGLVDNSVTE